MDERRRDSSEETFDLPVVEVSASTDLFSLLHIMQTRNVGGLLVPSRTRSLAANRPLKLLTKAEVVRRLARGESLAAGSRTKTIPVSSVSPAGATIRVTDWSLRMLLAAGRTCYCEKGHNAGPSGKNGGRCEYSNCGKTVTCYD